MQDFHLFEGMKKPAPRISRDENTCMYTEYFRLSEPPFSLTPDPRYLFMSGRHREGLAHLLYGVQQPGGFVQLTGDIGSGKTTLSRCLVRQLPPETDVALILNPRLTALELLATVCDELRIRYPADTGSIKVLIDVLNRHLLEAHTQHRKTVLIIDEAQNLSSDVLEQIRLLTNLETAQQKLLQIILIGQPELLSLLNRKGLRQLAQRITARYHLLPLSRHETYAYIQHRLYVAGRREPLFTASALRCVYRLSGGVPRLVNIICDRALLGAYATDKRQVSAAIVRRASFETRGRVPWYRKLNVAWAAGALALVAVAAGGALYFDLPHPWTARDSNPAGIVSKTLPAKSGPTQGEQPATPKNNPIRDALPEVSPRLPVAAAGISAPPVMHVTEFFADPSRGTLSSSFSDLFSRWGGKPSLNPGELGCASARVQGLDCLFLAGSWPKLRRYNVPAILELVLPPGLRKRATLVGLTSETATLSSGGREFTVQLRELEQVWDGSFIALWKPPFATRQLTPGSRGEEVAWVRHALDILDKKTPPAEVSDLYDEELRQRILVFQRDRSLIQDGLVGSETLVRLALAMQGPNAPSLSRDSR